MKQAIQHCSSRKDVLKKLIMTKNNRQFANSYYVVWFF